MRALAQLLVAAGVAVAAGGCVGDPGRNPCDAGNRTMDKLRDAVADFHLAVPAEATDVNFATSGGWMAYSLTLVFTTTPDGLTGFLDGSELPTPSTVDLESGLAAGQPSSPRCCRSHGSEVLPHRTRT